MDIIAEDDYNSFENVIGTLKSEQEYDEAKKKLDELYGYDPVNPAQEQSLNLDIKELEMKIAEYDKRMKTQ